MIYDEGFEVKISIQSYFAFSKYTAEKNQVSFTNYLIIKDGMIIPKDEDDE